MIRCIRSVLCSSAVLSAWLTAAPMSHAAGMRTTPIEHVVVIFQENVSYDHYFATYPQATNPAGEPAFTGNGKGSDSHGLNQQLLTRNPNLANPQRLGRSDALTCDMDHNYLDEQKAADGGQMDQFIQHTQGKNCGTVTTMDYFDGNTVTAIWNYAQRFAMSDNSFGTTYGPSTPGAINLISGQTHGAIASAPTKGVANGSDIGDLDPTFDDCSKGTLLTMTGKNVGDLLNSAGVTWGWFEGGFQPTGTNDGGTAMCGSQTPNISGKQITDYIPHHEPFQYYQSTANPRHLPPTSTELIGHTDQANHQYDLKQFWVAADAGNLPAVSYLKAPAAQDGHAGYSDPLDEQSFLVSTINHLQQLPTWSSTAVFISYDDSDGWYDHAYGPLVNPSSDPANDFACGHMQAGAYPDRCGYGPRLPLLVISPYAKQGFIDHSLSDQSSILRFIEDNWQLGQIGDQSFDATAGSLRTMFDFQSAGRAPILILDPSTGQVAS